MYLRSKNVLFYIYSHIYFNKGEFIPIQMLRAGLHHVERLFIDQRIVDNMFPLSAILHGEGIIVLRDELRNTEPQLGKCTVLPAL